MESNIQFTDREKNISHCGIVAGYIRRIAEEAKEDGLFRDLTVSDVGKLLILETIRDRQR